MSLKILSPAICCTHGKPKRLPQRWRSSLFEILEEFSRHHPSPIATAIATAIAHRPSPGSPKRRRPFLEISSVIGFNKTTLTLIGQKHQELRRTSERCFLVPSLTLLGSGQVERSRCNWTQETFQSTKRSLIHTASSLYQHHLIIITVITVITAVTTKYLTNPQIIVVEVMPPSLPSSLPSPW